MNTNNSTCKLRAYKWWTFRIALLQILPSNSMPPQSLWRQYIAGITGAMSILVAAAWFTWATPLLPQLLASDSPVPMNQEEASWMVSTIEIGIFIGLYPATYVADRFGRKFSIMMSSPFFTVGFLLIVYGKAFSTLLLARNILGFASAFPYVVIPLYLGEIASPEVRGTISAFYNVSFSLGCLIPYVIGPHLTYYSLTYAVFGLTILFVVCFMWQPESPYYYIMRDNTKEATKALKRLRGPISEELIQKEIEEITLEVKKGQEDSKVSWSDIYATRADRRALLLIIIVGIVFFFSGQNAMLSYSTETFTQYPNNLISADNVTIGIGAVAFLGSFLSLYTTDALGRRMLLLISSLCCTVTLFVASAYFFLHTHTDIDVTPYSWTAPVAIMLCNLFVAGGMDPVCVSYTAELFPTKTRGMASCISSINLSTCSFLVMKLYVTVALWMGIYFTYLFYGVICLVGFVLFYIVMPETKGKSFIQIREELMNS